MNFKHILTCMTLLLTLNTVPAFQTILPSKPIDIA